MRLKLYALVSLLCVAGVAALSVSDLSPDDLAQLKSELQAWKSSSVGKDAVKMGVAPKTTATISTLRAPEIPADQLQRFLESKRTVHDLQKKYPKTKFSLNTPFALMTQQEFAQFVNRSNVHAQRALMEKAPTRLRGSSLLPVHRGLGSPSQQQDHDQQKPLPTQVDWQQAGCVSHVKNQGSCGVCWIFAAIGALEGGYCAKNPGKTLPVLSEQDVVSCGPNMGSCMAGFTYIAYDWIIRQNGGSVCTEASYPYASWSDSGPACARYDDPNFKCDRPEIGLVSYVADQYEDHRNLEKIVATRPVAAQLRAGLPYLQFYSGGVLMGDETQCPSAYADHEVTIVGYGERDGTKYWKIKNSWGEWWGEQGYGYLERGFQGAPFGTCGIESWSYYPIFREEAPWTENQRCGSQRNGVEILGQTIKTVTVKDTYSGQCCDACRREPGCKAAVSFYQEPEKCVLKSTIEGERIDSAFGASSWVVMPKSDASYLCMPTEDNVDYPGNDYRRTLAPTAADCCDRCTLDPACGAYTWSKYMGGSCFLKYAKSAYQVHTPLPDGSAYFTSGEIYRCQPLKQNTDFPGEDFMSVPAKTAPECCALCRKNWPCMAFSWSNYQGGTCWLKKKAATPIVKSGVASATVF